jgi:hypothetical protein
MHEQYTPNPLLAPLQRHLTKPQWQNLVALLLAVQLGRTFVLRQLALFLLWQISSASCYRRLERLLAWEEESTWQPLRRLWVRAVLRTFAPGRGRIPLIIDWTWHRDRCKSLWLMLPVGGRAVPLCFWLAPLDTGGVGSQRALEDAALRDLKDWLPRSRRVLLLGDRGFRGRERIRTLQAWGWDFVLRITGDTHFETSDGWQTLDTVCPAVGRRWQRAGLRLGKGRGKADAPVVVHVVAVRQAVVPKPVRKERGHDGKLRERPRRGGADTAEETTWFLATNLPLTCDVVAVYAWRMQIEQTFRDYKALLGLEVEQTKQPWERLQALLWALMVGLTLDLQSGAPQARVPRTLPRLPQDAEAAPSLVKPRYRSESVTREGLHQLIVTVVLGTAPFCAELQAMAQKSQHMQARPQVRERRRTEPALRNRERRTPGPTPCSSPS